MPPFARIKVICPCGKKLVEGINKIFVLYNPITGKKYYVCRECKEKTIQVIIDCMENKK